MKRSLMAPLLLALIAACTEAGPGSDVTGISAPAGASRSVQSEPIPNRYIVRFRDNVPSTLLGARVVASRNDAVISHVYNSVIRGAAFEMSAAAAEKMKSDPSVLAVEQDQIVHFATTQSNPTWGLDRVDQRNLPRSNSYTYRLTGAGVTVYILDTGINFTHSEFGGRAVKGEDEITPDGTAADCHGHGTHVAGTVGGSTYGVAKGVKLVAVRVLDCNGAGSLASVIGGIDWMRQNFSGPSIANMSLGTGYSPAFNAVVENAIAAGITFVVAAGNSTANACDESPASASGAISVGATDVNDAFAYFSNYGRCVTLSAPGVSITSAWIGSTTASYVLSGTSMSSPHAAGAAALYLEAAPASTPAQVLAGLVGNGTADVIKALPASTRNLLLYTGFLNTVPVASFTSACTALTCTYDAGATSAIPSATYEWKFSDATVATGKTVTKVYAAAGTYTATLNVKDVNGTSTKSSTVTVTSPSGKPPVARFTMTCTTLSCVANASTSTADSRVALYSWNWGDGSPVETHGVPVIQKIYAAAGTYSVTLTAKDAAGLTNSTTKSIVVTGSTNKPPVARFTVNCAGLVCKVDASTSTDDVRVALYSWNWGDGSPIDTHGVPVIPKTYAKPGTYTITLTVRDGAGLSGTTTKSVIVDAPANQPPVARLTVRCIARACTADGSASTDDVRVVSYKWSWGDGTPSQMHNVPSMGWTYARTGTYVVTLLVTDDGGLTHSASTSVTVP